MALDVEGVVDGCVGREKSLGRAPALEALHLAFPSSGRLMRILGAVVSPSAGTMPTFDPKIAGSGPIRPQVIRDRPIGNEAVFFQKLAHQSQRGMFVSFRLDQHVEDFAFGVDGAPQVGHSAIDFG